MSSVVYCSVPLGFFVMIPRELILLLYVIIWSEIVRLTMADVLSVAICWPPRLVRKKPIEGAVAGLAGSVITGTALGVWLLG
jgi:hypothetical protein